jgi:hypothetical protein
MDFQVVPGELGTHADHVEAIADRLGTALAAANTAAMSDEAYGLLCAFVPPFIKPAEEKTIDSIKAAIDGVRTTAANLRTAGQAYTEQRPKPDRIVKDDNDKFYYSPNHYGGFFQVP